jgi:hypothetical protein
MLQQEGGSKMRGEDDLESKLAEEPLVLASLVTFLEQLLDDLK